MFALEKVNIENNQRHVNKFPAVSLLTAKKLVKVSDLTFCKDTSVLIFKAKLSLMGNKQGFFFLQMLKNKIKYARKSIKTVWRLKCC